MFRITLLFLASFQSFAQTQLPIATNFRNSYLTHVREENGLPGRIIGKTALITPFKFDFLRIQGKCLVM